MHAGPRRLNLASTLLLCARASSSLTCTHGQVDNTRRSGGELVGDLRGLGELARRAGAGSGASSADGVRASAVHIRIPTPSKKYRHRQVLCLCPHSRLYKRIYKMVSCEDTST